MMTRFPLVFALMLVAMPCLAAPTPEEIIDGFFGPDHPPDRATDYAGEMKAVYWEEPTFGQMLGSGRHYTAHRLDKSSADEPVYDVALDSGYRWYAYFVRLDGVLKLTSIRLAERKDEGNGGVTAPPQGR
jgi:hypothetical protein